MQLRRYEISFMCVPIFKGTGGSLVIMLRSESVYVLFEKKCLPRIYITELEGILLCFAWTHIFL